MQLHCIALHYINELTLKQVLKQMPSGLQADLFQGGKEVQKSSQANSITWFKPEV
jgi:hypothetical protein